jgi:flagellin-specific chaperone FliS
MFSQAVVEVRAVMPEFFSQRRIRAMRDVFHEIDVDEGLNLDQEELAPFYEYVFYKLFDVNLTRDEQKLVKRMHVDDFAHDDARHNDHNENTTHDGNECA